MLSKNGLYHWLQLILYFPGTFTVAGIVDSFIYHGQKAIKKKMEIGKLRWSLLTYQETKKWLLGTWLLVLIYRHQGSLMVPQLRVPFISILKSLFRTRQFDPHIVNGLLCKEFYCYIFCSIYSFALFLAIPGLSFQVHITGKRVFVLKFTFYYKWRSKGRVIFETRILF